MDIQFINITSFRGISTNAEHYYAKFASEKNAEDIAENIFCDCSVASSCDTDMLFYPDREQAIALIEKDNQMLDGIYKENIDEQTIARYMEKGTIRFPSILDVVRQARKQFPHSIFKFYLQGSEEEFRRTCKNMRDMNEALAIIEAACDIRTTQEEDKDRKVDVKMRTCDKLEMEKLYGEEY